MPYRRLPTTDLARVRALETALKIAEDKNDKELAFPRSTLEELKIVKTAFHNTLTQYELDLKIQSEKLQDYKMEMETAKMYVSHFIQVLYLSSERGEINGGIKFYDLNDCEGKVPPLNSAEEILEWGKKIVDGEQKRIQNGGSAIYNPSIALVKIKLEAFRDASIFQTILKRNVTRSYEKMQNLRKSTNDFISKLWTEIEDNIISDSPKHNRQQAQEYGIVYVFRRKEKKKLKQEDLQRDLLFDFG